MKQLMDNLRNAKETELELYMAMQRDTHLSREITHNYHKAQDKLVEAKEAVEEMLKQFRDFTEGSPELFTDDKASQMMEWLLLGSVKLDDL